MRKTLFHLFLLVPTLVLLLVVEAGFRIQAYYADARLQQGLNGVGKPVTGEEFSLRHIIRWNDNPRIIYELIPGLTGEFRGNPLTINSQGFRGALVPVEKSPCTYRIAGIGDSVMFGWGVADSEFYLARLGEVLANARPDIRFEGINSAVPGYSTVSEVETLKRKLLVYQPDLVIVGYVGNDLYPPGFIRKRRPYLALDYSFLARFVRYTIKGLHVPDNMLQRPPDAFRHASFQGEEDLIPDEYQELIGINAFRAAVVELQQLSAAHDFRVLTFAFYGVDPEPLAVLEDLGVETLDGSPMANTYLKEHGLTAYPGSPLTVSRKDSHPSAVHHRMIAELLAKRIGGTIGPASSRETPRHAIQQTHALIHLAQQQPPAV